jgi:catechol 2,3-dioxygenase-like lactoylglutathione lyase family enzyme
VTDTLGQVGAITLFVEDVRRSKSFYEQTFDVPVIHEDDDSVVFGFEDTAVNLLRLAAAGELVEPARVAGREAGSRFQLTVWVEDANAVCARLAARGVTLLEADTDGVYFAVPPAWTEADERRVVAEVAALLPPLVQLELEGRYAAMLSHEPKNYALLGYDGKSVFKGVAFRSSRAEPFGQKFLRRAIDSLLAGDVADVRAVLNSPHHR